MPLLPDAPTQVRGAIALLWVSLAMSIALTVFEWEPISTPEEAPQFELLLFGSMVVGYAIPALLISMASRRRNWARILLLAFTALWIGLYVAYWDEETAEPPWSGAATLLMAALDLIALYWLFTGEGGEWFRRRAPAEQV